MIGSFYFASTLLLFNMYIGLLTETFYKVYDNASAYASIEQATTILNMEKVLSQDKMDKVADYIHENCEPCVCHSPFLLTDLKILRFLSLDLIWLKLSMINNDKGFTSLEFLMNGRVCVISGVNCFQKIITQIQITFGSKYRTWNSLNLTK